MENSPLRDEGLLSYLSKSYAKREGSYCAKSGAEHEHKTMACHTFTIC